MDFSYLSWNSFRYNCSVYKLSDDRKQKQILRPRFKKSSIPRQNREAVKDNLWPGFEPGPLRQKTIALPLSPPLQPLEAQSLWVFWMRATITTTETTNGSYKLLSSKINNSSVTDELTLFSQYDFFRKLFIALLVSLINYSKGEGPPQLSEKNDLRLMLFSANLESFRAGTSLCSGSIACWGRCSKAHDDLD